MAAITAAALYIVVSAAATASAATIQPTIVRIVATPRWSPPSPDPMGIGYDPGTGHLLVTDSEVEETSLWQNVNLYETTTAGVVVAKANLTGFTREPTDVAVHPTTGRYFFSDDNAGRIFEVGLGADARLGTSDDTRRSFRFSADLEGIDFGGGGLFIADGLGQRIHHILPGANDVFEAAGDDVVSRIGVGRYVNDPEDVAYDAATGHLFIAGRGSSSIVETTLTGTLVNTYDLSSAVLRNGSGIAIAPSSDGSGATSLYVTDRGRDNDTRPSENDGRLIEAKIRRNTTTTVVGSTTAVVDDASTDWQHSHTWSTVAGSVYVGGTRHDTTASDAWAQTGITGGGWRYVATTGPGMGIAEVLVDGMRAARVDLYSPRVVNQVAVAEMPMAPGRHVLRIKHTGERNASATGSVVNIDAVVVIPLGVGPGIHEDTKSAAWSTNGTWWIDRASAYSGGARHRSNSRWSRAALAVQGARFEVLASMGPDQGILTVWVDGKRVQSVNLYRSAPSHRRMVFTTALARGWHVVRLEVAGVRDPRSRSGQVNYDAIVVRS